MDLCIDSWKTDNIEFYKYYENKLDSKVDDCTIEVEAIKFVQWAINKNLNPPKQLLELMGFQKQDAKKVPKPKDYTTPYMGLMFEVIEALNISEANQPAKQQITSWLKQRDSQLSERERNYIATFVRTPDMKKGGYYKGNK